MEPPFALPTQVELWYLDRYSQAGPALATATPAERDDPASAVERICTEPFDLATGPLFRAALLTFAPQDHVLVLNVHHIVADAWSLSLLEADLATAYCAARDGTAPPPPAAGGLSGLVRSCLAERDGPTRHRDLEYWTGVLDGVPPRLALPGHPAAGRTHPFAVDRLRRPLPSGIEARLGSFCGVNRVTPAQVLFAGYA